MERSYAILIDAGFVKRKLGSKERPVGVADISDFIRKLQSHDSFRAMTLHRIYYYDAPPLTAKVDKPFCGGKLDFGATEMARANTSLLDSLRRLPYFAVRTGEVVFRGWALNWKALDSKAKTATITAADVRPNVQQKGVDMRIGMDIAALTLKRQAQVIVLVTGDSDFIPAMKFARREGAQLVLVTFGHPIAPVMYEHADLVIEDP